MSASSNKITKIIFLLTCIFLFPIVARGSTVLAKSVTESRIKENLKIVDLDSKDLDVLAQLTKEKAPVRYVYPPFGINFGFPDKQEGKALKNGVAA
jgi:hypothetical protein